MSSAIRILGIDPGLNATGWGGIDQTGSRLSLVSYGVIKAPSKAPMAERLTVIYNAIEELVIAHQPHEAAVEDQFVHASAVTATMLARPDLRVSRIQRMALTPSISGIWISISTIS